MAPSRVRRQGLRKPPSSALDPRPRFRGLEALLGPPGGGLRPGVRVERVWSLLGETSVRWGVPPARRWRAGGASPLDVFMSSYTKFIAAFGWSFAV